MNDIIYLREPRNESRTLENRVAIKSSFEGTLDNYSRSLYSSGKERLMDPFDDRFYRMASEYVEEPS